MWVFFDSQQSLLFLVVPEEAFLIPSRVRWRVGYGGNNVGALSKSAKERDRGRKGERDKSREKERQGTRGITGGGEVVGMRTRMGMGGR